MTGNLDPTEQPGPRQLSDAANADAENAATVSQTSVHDLEDTVDSEHPAGLPQTIDLDSAGAPAGRSPSLDETARDFADYELIDEIARGGMGVVYRARQKSANRVVALKMILAGRFAGEGEVERFHAEAEAAAQLDHPHIVPVFDVGMEAGHHYFSMGYVDGESLSPHIHRGPSTSREAAQMMMPIASAIHYAHQRGVIHRDLKPGNILVTQDGMPRITDFGLAKQLGSGRDLTATGQVMGTPSYMPPEQASGQTADAGPAADVYALGAILYALLTGRPPFQAASAIETIRQVIEKDPLSPRSLNPEIDPDLETVCLKCLEKFPHKRYDSAEALAEELTRFLDGKPVLARPISKPERVWRWCRRNHLTAGLLGGIGVALTLGICFSTYFALLANQRAVRAQQGTQIALTTLETMVNTIQVKLADIPAAREVRREILRDSLADLQKVSGEVQSQSRVDRSTARVLRTLALIFNEVGDDDGRSVTPIVKEHFERSLDIYRQLHNQADDLSLDREYAEALNFMGDFYIQQNQTAAAEPLLADAIDVLREVLLADSLAAKSLPGSADRGAVDRDATELSLTYALVNRGDCFAMSGRFKGSLPYYLEAIEICRSLIERDPSHHAYSERLADCLIRLGDAHHDLGENDAALPPFTESLQLSQAWLEREPASALALDVLSFSHERLGNHWMKVGDANQAKAHYAEMLALTEQALKLDPQSRFLLEGLVVCHEKRASAHASLGETEQAAQSRKNASEVQRGLR